MEKVYKIIKSEADFLDLKASWEELEIEYNSTYPSISFKWCYLWWSVFKNVENNTIGYNKKLVIVCCYENDKLVLVAPLIQLKRKIGTLKITFLEFLGQQWGSIAITILKKYDFVFKDLMEFIKNNVFYHILYLRQIPIRESNLFSQEIKKYSGSPYVVLTNYANMEDLKIKNYSKSLKQNIRTAYNRIRKDNLTFEMHNEEVCNDNFKDIVRLSKLKLIDDKQCLYLDNNKALFYKEVFMHFPSNVVFVKVNDTNIAYRANIIYNNNKICIDASYDRNFKKYDPGIISVDCNFIDSFSKKLNVDNLGPGLDDYKLKFTKDIQYLGYLLIPGNLFGSLILTNIFKKYLNRKFNKL